MSLSQLLLVLAVLCFGVAFLVAIEAITSNDMDAWLTGGLLLFAAGHLSFADRRIG